MALKRAHMSNYFQRELFNIIYSTRVLLNLQQCLDVCQRLNPAKILGINMIIHELKLCLALTTLSTRLCDSEHKTQDVLKNIVTIPLVTTIHVACTPLLHVTTVARFMGPTWGPSGANRTQVGPMVAPWTLLSGKSFGVMNHIAARLQPQWQ